MDFAFGDFVVDRRRFQLLRNGCEVALERRTFDLLCYLIEHRERVVSKEELLENVWEARALSDGVLSNTVAKLRRALAQQADERAPIETVHGRGYRFRAEDTAQTPHPAGPPRERPARVTDPFVGRETLLQSLTTRLTQAGSGAENLVVLSGEAGIGKTRITRELSVEARRRGYRCWSGAAYEGGGAPPYWPWIQVLRAAREDLGEPTFFECLPKGAWAIAQLAAELPSQAPGTPEHEPQMARFQLFEEVTRFLRAVGRRAPLLLVLDDLHCADQASVQLLGFAARSLQSDPVFLVCTLRTGEITQPDGFAALDELGRVASVVSVKGLNEAQVRELSQALLETSEIAPEQVDALNVRTQGNPLFVRQTLQLIEQQGGFGNLGALLTGDALPPPIRHVIRRRIAAFSAETRQALEASAVLGKSFESTILAEALGQPLETVLGALEPALRVGFLEPASDLPGSLTFAHELTREVLYQDLPLLARGALHGRIASALSRRQVRDRLRHLNAVAHHFLHAVPVDLSQIIPACREAARAAQEASGFEAAAQLLARAIHALETGGGPNDLRIRLLLELGEDQFYAGAVVHAWTAFHDAALAAQEHGRNDLLAEAAPRLLDCLELGVGDEHFARRVVQRALTQAAADDAALQANLLTQRAELATELSSEERASILERAERLARACGSEDALLEVAHSRAILRDPTRLAENQADAAHFLALLAEHPAAAASMRYRSLRRFGAYLTHYVCALTACDLASADAALEECARIADHSHVRAAQFAVDLMRAGRALGDGRIEDLMRLVPLAAPPSSTKLPAEAPAWGAYFGMAIEAQGKLNAIAAIDFEAYVSAQHTPARNALYSAVGRACMHALLGNLERVRALLAQIPATELARMPVRYGDLATLCTLAEIHLALDEHAALEDLYVRLLPHASHNAVGPVFEYRGAVAHFLGLVGQRLGKPEARDWFERARVIHEQLRMPAALAATLRALG